MSLAYPGAVSALETSLDTRLLDLLDVQKTFLLEEGFIPNDFALSDFVAHEPLEKARQIVAAEQQELRASA